MARFAVHAHPYWRPLPMKASTDFERLNLKINPPRVVFDNESDDSATVITVDSANKQGCLLEVVQLLTDLDLVVTKARVSSDGGWFVDVFHVTHENGLKVSDARVTSYIQQKLGAIKAAAAPIDVPTCRGRNAVALDNARPKLTGIELTGNDRPGLLHDLAVEITALGCSVLAAEVWTHNHRVAFVIYVTESSGSPITNPSTLHMLSSRLKRVMGDEGCPLPLSPLAKVTDGLMHSSRRMHQLMFEDRDFDSEKLQAAAGEGEEGPGGVPLRPRVTVRNSPELGYSVVNVKCMDRPKLLFDTVCTLTDMQYVIHHANVESDDGLATQEYFLRSVDGSLLESEAEQERLVKCLYAAIQRHTPSGTCLELCASDRVGLLADVTGIFKSKGISIAAATVSTQGGKALNEFFVVGEDGGSVDRNILEALQRQVGPSLLTIRRGPVSIPGSPARDMSGSSGVGSFSITNMLRVQSEKFLASLGLITPSTSLP